MLDPEYDMIAKAAPFIEQVLMDRFKPQRVAEDISTWPARELSSCTSSQGPPRPGRAAETAQTQPAAQARWP